MISFTDQTRIQKEVTLGLIPKREDNSEERAYRVIVAREFAETPKSMVSDFVSDWDGGYGDDDTSLAFDPDKHPRLPKGDSKGGWFTDAEPQPVQFTLQALRDNPEAIEDNEKVGARLAEYGLSLETAAQIAGTQDDGAVVEVIVEGHLLGVDVKHKLYTMNRTIDLKNKTIYNNDIKINETGTGLGAKIFAGQVDAAVKAGFKKIATNAAGDSNAKGRMSKFNGYYTWPRLGYDQSIDAAEQKPNVIEYAHKHKLERVSDFMKNETHREYWKKNARGLDATFDLTEGSQSRRVLDEYVKQKGKL